MALRILVDSTFDFTPEQLELTGIEVVRLHVNFGGEDFVDGVDITPEGFYERLIESDALPTTSQAAPADFAEAFERLTANGDELVCLTISSKLSGTYQSAMIAAADFEGRVRVVDTLNVALGAQILARYALRLASGGRGLDEVADELERVKGRVHIIALLDTLEYLKRGGRISAAAAAVGGAFSIKPVITVRDGAVAVIGKARGSKNGENLLSQLIEKHGVDFTMPYVLGYTGLSDALLQKYKADSARLWVGYAKDLPVSIVGSVVGTHAGPGAIAVAFFGKE
ncbi:MAG TPA: DegV family protein [Candidatus Scatomorpha merdipullorum]|uniref:DegV family protein n=1 Tax=Candidatus Scatomorpha merdipullorum TaxID=2840927 RepID=A0A9D1FBQ2_9FIRM|nr:DegV family protein [Candidatus Scatomorpha merdipullorum]